MRLYLTTLAAAAFAAGFGFTLDTSSMTGSLAWSHANGSAASAGIRHIATGSPEWVQAFNAIDSSLYGFGYEDSGGNWQTYMYPPTVVNGGDLPGVLTADHFGIVDYGLWSGTPVVGLAWEFTADAALKAAIPGHSLPLPIPATYAKFHGGHMLHATMSPNPGSPWSTNFELPFGNVDAIEGNFGWVVVPPSHTVPNSFQDRRYLLFGSLDLSDPDPNNHRVVLYDGVEMSLDARVVPEPASMTALALGAIGLMARRAKRNR